jgi:hypothetical protein
VKRFFRNDREKLFICAAALDVDGEGATHYRNIALTTVIVAKPATAPETPGIFTLPATLRKAAETRGWVTTLAMTTIAQSDTLATKKVMKRSMVLLLFGWGGAVLRCHGVNCTRLHF